MYGYGVASNGAKEIFMVKVDFINNWKINKWMDE